MMKTKSKEGMLSPYRVLDLTDEKGQLCGKLFSDLGADVIKVEPPGGDPARKIGPFYHDEIDPEKSLFWFAFNTGKRSITLDLENNREDRETFKKLVSGADFVFESYPPGYMEGLGLGYKDLEAINPGVILVSITPFGQTGPYKDYKASDIVLWAMGGQMFGCGDPDRPPLKISDNSQSYLNASVEAASSALLALYQRRATGSGQHVDVSAQECLACSTFQITSMWDMVKKLNKRQGTGLNVAVKIKQVWPCKDGYVLWYFVGGPMAKELNSPIVNWLNEENMADDHLLNFNWDQFEYTSVTQTTINLLEKPVSSFFLSHTKKELLAGAVKHHLVLYPISNTKDILSNAQLNARNFWIQLRHDNIGANITYPGAYVKSSANAPRVKCRAPFIGEHNNQIRNEFQLPGITNSNQFQKKIENIKKLCPLEGIKIIDFGRYAALPKTTKVFADYGAQVIKIEGRNKLDVMRTAHPFKDNIPGLNRAGDFNQINTSKLSLCVNLSKPGGIDLIKKLVAWADIAVENFSGTTMKRMGMGYEDLKRVNPKIIMMSSCMQGQTGPYCTHSGFGWHLTALTGFHEITGWPDRAPVGPFGPYTDFVASRFATLAILAALEYRTRTGNGVYIDQSQFECGVHFISPLLLDCVTNGRVATKMGNHAYNAVPHNAYRCLGEDKWCVISVSSQKEWMNFCNVIGNPTWTRESRFNTFADRKQNESELDNLIEAWTANKPAEEVMSVLQNAHIPAGIVQSGEDLLDNDPQLKHRHAFYEVHHKEIGKYLTPRSSAILSKASYRIQSAPCLGEHNEHILKQILHMTDADISQLILDEVIE